MRHNSLLDGGGAETVRRSVLPYSKVYLDTGDPIEQGGLVEFRLLYEGELLPSGNNKTRAPEKHAIRRSLHPQLRRQWQVNSALRQLAGYLGTRYDPILLETEQEQFDHGIASIGKKWSMFGYEFVPLVTSAEDASLLNNRGDIDGQVKTIFDALRLPNSPEQLGGMKPQHDETPFFCLFEDDKMISEVHLNADQLLLLPHQREVKANDAFVVIHVRTNAKTPGAIGNYLA
jgi:hypothetical protein